MIRIVYTKLIQFASIGINPMYWNIQQKIVPNTPASSFIMTSVIWPQTLCFLDQIRTMAVGECNDCAFRDCIIHVLCRLNLDNTKGHSSLMQTRRWDWSLVNSFFTPESSYMAGRKSLAENDISLYFLLTLNRKCRRTSIRRYDSRCQFVLILIGDSIK